MIFFLRLSCKIMTFSAYHLLFNHHIHNFENISFTCKYMTLLVCEQTKFTLWMVLNICREVNSNFQKGKIGGI